MKLSNETVAILKNFGAINQGILFKPGKNRLVKLLGGFRGPVGVEGRLSGNLFEVSKQIRLLATLSLGE